MVSCVLRRAVCAEANYRAVCAESRQIISTHAIKGGGYWDITYPTILAILNFVSTRFAGKRKLFGNFTHGIIRICLTKKTVGVAEMMG